MRFTRLRQLMGTLRFKLTVRGTMVVFLAILVTLIAVRLGVWFTLLHDTDQHLREDAIELSLAVQQLYPDLDQIHEEMDRKAVGHRYRQFFVQMLNDQGRVEWSSVNTPPINFPQIDNNTTTIGAYRVTQQRVEYAGIPRYTLRVGSALEPVYEDMAQLTWMLILVGTAMLLVSPVFSYWIAGIATRPIQSFSNAAALLRPEKLQERLPIAQNGQELDQLAVTMNGLLDRIAAYLHRNQEFVANAAHELRSPLAAIRSTVELGLNAERSINEYQELLADVVEECAALGALVNQLLILAESDAGIQISDAQVVRLDTLLLRSVEMFYATAEEREIALRVERPFPPCTVQGFPSHLRQIVNNLIDNAIKFNRPGGSVTIGLELDKDRVNLRVNDTGTGIAADELKNIFERFYRGDKSRHREGARGGTGLGLSICDSIVRAYGGSITVESTVGRGTQFTVNLINASVNDRLQS